MRVTTIFGTTLALIAGIGGVAAQVACAIQLQDGTVYFAQPPNLVAATTTFKSVNEWGATYYFTINLPQKAGEPLQRLTITQQSGGDNIRFKLKDSRAFVGTRNRKGAQLTLGEATQERKTRTVSVTFEPPVTPGQTVTIGLRPVENPRNPGVYLFGVEGATTRMKVS
jgi:broad specificity polyphosphatase/5'/3'-nucleotidase SurE